ncbi:MAG: [FeFe] hydrogenase H-cluster radical SAM maturase HydE [Bacillota bacterium]
MAKNKVEETVDKAYKTAQLTKNEIIFLLSEKISNLEYLIKKADEKRQEIFGRKVHLRAIIEFSSCCRQNCYYCGLRKDNRSLERYRLTGDEIINTALKAADLGYRTVVLQSGEDNYPAEDLADIIEEIKNRADIAVTLSVGERSFADYLLWEKVGADRYLLKHETADRTLYKKYHPGMNFENRINCLRYLKKIGYQIGSGVIVDLPGQTAETLADDLFLCQDLDLDMMGSGPFIPHRNTPLKDKKTGSVEMTLKVTALSRLLMPKVHIPATTALGTIDPEGRKKALKAGANVIMPNVTDSIYRKKYQIYPNKTSINTDEEYYHSSIAVEINSLGRTIASNKGHSLKIE